MTRLTPSVYTLLPRLDDIFFAVRLIAFAGMGLWSVIVPGSLLEKLPVVVLLGVFGAHLVFLLFAISRRLLPPRSLYFSILIFDLVFLALLTRFTGGFDSQLLVLYCMFLPFETYVLGLYAGIGASVAATATFIGANITLPDAGFPLNLLLFFALLWMFCIGPGYFANYSGKAEKRLLNALDKLNERTTEVERANQRLEMVYEASQDLGTILKVDDVIQRVLTIARNLFRYPLCEILLWDEHRSKLSIYGRVEEKRITPFDPPRPVRLIETYTTVLQSGKARRVLHEDQSTSGKSTKIRSQLAVPMKTQGKIVGILNAEAPGHTSFNERDEHVFAILANSAALALDNAFMHQKMEQLTITDELTGTYNYRFFKMRLDDEMKRSVRYGQPLSLIMIDIDWFKRFNDTYGHESGNQLLRRLSSVIADNIRDVDILARYGGEEFIIILPQTGQDEAYTLGERIREKISEIRLKVGPDGKELARVTVSVGISCYPENGRGEDELVESVDQALYRAKGAGKNLVCTI